eukprot:gene47524-27659_t
MLTKYDGHARAWSAYVYDGEASHWPTVQPQHVRELVQPEKSPYPEGVCGLQNVGNTCYMNSALQCLASCDKLCGYFADGGLGARLNGDNPLASKGNQIAKMFSEFAVQLRPPKNSDVVQPKTVGRKQMKEIQNVMCRSRPEAFLHAVQGDAQEMMQALLDGLHEDVNSVVRPPYFDTARDEELPDHDAATRALARLAARNSSPVFTLFSGLQCSRLTCAEAGCGRQAATFDQIGSGILPIAFPPKVRTLQAVHVAREGPSREFEMQLRGDAGGATIRAAAAAVIGLPPSRVTVLVAPRYQDSAAPHVALALDDTADD